LLFLFSDFLLPKKRKKKKENESTLKTERKEEEITLKTKKQKDRKKRKKLESTFKQKLFDGRAEDFLNTQISRMYCFDL
jgi:hypothetical protein